MAAIFVRLQVLPIAPFPNRARGAPCTLLRRRQSSLRHARGRLHASTCCTLCDGSAIKPVLLLQLRRLRSIRQPPGLLRLWQCSSCMVPVTLAVWVWVLTDEWTVHGRSSARKPSSPGLPQLSEQLLLQ